MYRSNKKFILDVYKRQGQYIVLAVVVGNGDGFHPGGQVGQSHIADSAFGLAYRLDHGSGGGHGQAAAHVCLLYTFRCV